MLRLMKPSLTLGNIRLALFQEVAARKPKVDEGGDLSKGLASEMCPCTTIGNEIANYLGCIVISLSLLKEYGNSHIK